MSSPTPGGVNFGPGTLKIGATAAPVDVSCLVNSCRLAATKDQGDAVTKLCGTKVPGSVDYSWEMTGNMDIDPNDPAGIFLLSATAYGTVQDYEFTPNTESGMVATGQLVLDPLDFGADEYGSPMTSDYAFALTGAPTYTPASP